MSISIGRFRICRSRQAAAVTLLSAPQAVLWLVPALVLAFSAWSSSLHGPFYLGANLDPEYPYLLNGLRLLGGHSPVHFDHPGTPLQLLIAVLIGIAHWVWGLTALPRDVLSYPEFYLGVAHLVLVSLNVLAVWFVGRLAWAVHGRPFLALAAQLGPFLALGSFEALSRVSPEPLLLVAGVVLAGALLRGAEDGDWRWLVPVSAGLVGFMTAVKITAAPLILIPLLLARRGRRPLAVLVAGGVWLLATLPVSPHYLQMARFYSRLATRSGRYGSGDIEVDLDLWGSGLGALILGEPLFILTVAASLGFLLWLRQADRQVATNGWLPGRQVLLAVTVAQLAQLLLVAKHPGAHYLLPAEALLGANLAILGRFWLRAGGQRGTSSATGSVLTAPRARTLLRIGLLVLATLALLIQTWRVGLQAWSWSETRDEQRAVVETIREQYAGWLEVGLYRASGRGYALHFGNLFAGRRFTRELSGLHPDLIHLNRWTGSISWSGREVSWEQIENRARRRVLLHGSPDFILEELPDRPVLLRTSGEWIISVTPEPNIDSVSPQNTLAPSLRRDGISQEPGE